MSFGDVIRSVGSPGSTPSGIGGDSSMIWHCDSSPGKIYELAISDFSVIRYVWATSGAEGIGGDSSTIWHCDSGTDKVYELAISDLSKIRNASSQGILPMGIGGDSNTIWHSDAVTDKIYKLNTTDFSVIRYGSSPTGTPMGVGGDDSTICHCEIASYKIYELDTTDFSVIRNASSPSTGGYGIGGKAEIMWHCDGNSNRIYELDAAGTYTLSGTISDEWGNPIRDADITISNGTNYTTTSDENGDYSQVVDSDTYDIAVSKSRSTYHDITISSVAVTADTTQDITMLLDKMLGRQNAIKGISIPGGISMGRSRR